MGQVEHTGTIIIGAGMSGLAAGIRLAQFGQQVRIVEKHYLWGGLNSYYKLGGRRFDVGLHALTNFVRQGTPGAKQRPLARILRQLRIDPAELGLGEQSSSRVAFPGVSLRFSNDFELLRSEVHANFPKAASGFDRLSRDVLESAYETDGLPGSGARSQLIGYLGDPTLVDMLLLPILYYGSPTERDIEWSSFIVLWKSLYEEGFARPKGGVRTILDILRRRYLDLGGELRMRCGVQRILLHGDRAVGVVLEDGSELRADRILSSAGYVETMRLARAAERVPKEEIGRLSFVESISVLDQPASELGFDDTILFFNTDERLVYERPEAPVDYRSGVICCPEHYASSGPEEEPVLRLTLLADYDTWKDYSDDEYVSQKDEVWSRSHERIASYGSDVRAHTVFHDTFTPRTIERFTSHVNGAVYGSTAKRENGESGFDGLYICGTDQGYLGIVGAMLSGISIANKKALITAERA